MAHFDHHTSRQNVSKVAVAPNGRSHKIGHIEDVNGVAPDTATHWSKREECRNCPVLQSCQGGSMFLEGDLWEIGCNNAFSDHIPYFAAVIELITGYLPIWIDGPLQPDRRDIFGFVADEAHAAAAWMVEA